MALTDTFIKNAKHSGSAAGDKHSDGGGMYLHANGNAYNRTAHLPARREMLQRWADYLDQLRTGAQVIELHSKVA